MKEKLAMPCTGQQWEQDINNGGEPENFNSWIEKQALTSVKSESAEDSPILSDSELKKVIGEQARKHEKIELESDFHSFIAGAIWMHDFANNSEEMKEDFKYFFGCGRNYQNNAEITFNVAYTEYLTNKEK